MGNIKLNIMTVTGIVLPASLAIFLKLVNFGGHGDANGEERY